MNTQCRYLYTALKTSIKRGTQGYYVRALNGAEDAVFWYHLCPNTGTLITPEEIAEREWQTQKLMGILVR